MDIVLLREFLAVAQCRNMTEAAKHLHFSQSTLSGHMKCLEQEMGATLLNREKPLRLTGAGAALVRHASVVVAQYEIMLDAVGAAALEFAEAKARTSETER